MIRNRPIDICKGIAILAMIIGHCNFPYMPLPQSFHMPLFFIVAGYFYKQKNIKDAITKDFDRLVAPYAVFAAIYVLKFTITKSMNGEGAIVVDCLKNAIWAGGPQYESNVIFSSMHAIGAIWFLPAMFWCKTIYNIISRNVTKKITQIIILAALSLVSIYLFNNVINLPFGLLTGCSALMFYGIGHLAQSINLNKINPLMIFGLILSWICAFVFSYMNMVECRYDHLPLNYIGGCGGTFAIYLLSRFLDAHTDILSKGLAWCGRYSMVILCFHFVNAIIDLERRLGTSNWILLFIAQMIILVPIVFVCCKMRITRKLFAIK